MTDEKKAASAKTVYDTLCAAIERNGWRYNKEEDTLRVSFTVNGDDIPMFMIVEVDAERQLICLMSPSSFKFGEDKRVEGAIATCEATYRLADGSFDYDISDGRVLFRLTSSFRESLIGEGLLHYMIDCACAVVDEYNDKFLALSKGMLKIEDFLGDN